MDPPWTRTALITAALRPCGVRSSTLSEVLARRRIRRHRLPGTSRPEIDLEPYLWGEMFEPLTADYDLFRQVAVDERGGTICWPNGADLSPRRLYAEAKAVIPA